MNFFIKKWANVLEFASKMERISAQKVCIKCRINWSRRLTYRHCKP
jgi:hypothetical protein